MIVYSYDKDGIFTGSMTARLDPLETEKQNSPVYLIPANATAERPPEIEPKQAAIFNGTSWDILPDFRGVTIYDTATKDAETVSQAGEPIKPGFTDLEPGKFDEWNGQGWFKNEAQELEYVKALKLNQLIQQADAAVAPIINTYPKIEVDSWPKQIEEANAWLADNTAITPLIDGIAMQRGIDKTVLVGKILENSFNYSTISGNVIGARQKLEGQIIAASTLAEIEAIEVVI